MSTSNVASDTLALAEREGLRMAQLPSWYDVDNGDSLMHLYVELRSLSQDRARHTRGFLDKLRQILNGHSQRRFSPKS